MTYQVVIKRDGDAPENEGGVIASFVTRECANAFVDGVEYVNCYDSSLLVAVVEIERPDEAQERYDWGEE
tara:strand:- start:164 stop:373 length:210 start_codon:yes stop_codon:yes gene_type:complete